MASLVPLYGESFAARADLPLPEGYRSYRSCREYFEREAAASSSMKVIGNGGGCGASWRHGPFRFEKFTGDDEPTRDHAGPLRLVIWQRLSRRDAPAGWYTGPMDMGYRMTGLAIPGPDVERDWSPHARRHASRWRKLAASGKRETVSLSLEEYLAAHGKAELDLYVKLAFPGILREKSAAHGDRLRLIGSRRPGGPIDAGLAFLHVPEARNSVHIAAFMGGEAKEDPASTGLIMRWFEECARDGIAFMDFGFFWAPGDPRDWRGFSRFKSGFGVRPVRYPPPLLRLAGSLFGKASSA